MIRNLISKRVAMVSVGLLILQVALFALVASKPIYYDEGGVLGLLWFINAFLVPTVVAVAILIISAISNWSMRRN